jgi:hypothetical protein
MPTASHSSRRRFIGRTILLGSAGLVTGCEGPQLWDNVTTTVDRPGIALGHVMRDASKPLQFGSNKSTASFEIEKRCQVLVIGSGIAGLSAVWNLRRQGVQDILLLSICRGASGANRCPLFAPAFT